MNRAWTLLKAHPYICNVAGYTTLFVSADLIQQSMLAVKSQGSKSEESLQIYSTGHIIDWSQTARMAVIGFCFHANFNYHWLKGLERMLPGGGPMKITGKVVLDQLIAAPATISAFFIGLSILEHKEDPLGDWRQKFWISYKTGVIYWSTMQAVNFALVPPVARTVFLGGITLGWTVFLCHFRQQQGLSSSRPTSQ